MGKTINLVKLAIAYTAAILAHFGFVDEDRGKRVADLAWPRIVTESPESRRQRRI